MKKLLFLGGSAALLSYIGSELSKARNRYDVSQKVLCTDDFDFVAESLPDAISGTKQLSCTYRMNDKTGKKLGCITLFMGQEKNSYYGGHIVYEGYEQYKKAAYLQALESANKQFMSHVYFVCNAKDKSAISFYESLGAVYNKDLLIPEGERLYTNKKQKPMKQYKLTFEYPKK